MGGQAPPESGKPPRLLSIGECMLELHAAGTDRYRLGFGGDTLNTAVYLARLGINADYATALGDDPYSDTMIAHWRAEGVGTERVVRLPGRLPGLYIIRNDAGGERAFFYWRGQAAARELFSGAHAAALIEHALAYDWLYLSGVTLSLYDATGTAALHALLRRFRDQGGRVAFDSNYRPRCWANEDAARRAFDAVCAQVDVALPSLEDEQALYGDADSADCADRLMQRGIAEIVIKRGSAGCLVCTAGHRRWLPIAAPVAAIDATAAGDAFNAGYLAARLRGADPIAAAWAGQRLAAAVVTHRGAIIPRTAMPELQSQA